MALMDLLTAGRSLSEARERPHRYKVRKGAFPKFGDAPAPWEQRGAEKNSGVVNSRPMTTETMAAETVRKSPSGERWALPGNPFKRSRAPAPIPAVQGELSLDRVKPVRNDLSDSDLELVAATKRPETPPSAVEIESVHVPVVKVRSLWARMRGLFQRAR